MFQLRRFKNSDPPALAEIWKSQPLQRGLVQPMSSSVLEQFVFAKQYFEADGLVVATRDGEPMGFAHGGFGPDETGRRLSHEMGATQMLMVHGDLDEPALADELLGHCEEYLRSRGARVLYGGGMRPLDAFYLGLYGGSEVSGVLESDRLTNEVFRRNGYEVAAEALVMQRDLARFRPPVTREQRAVRREVNLEYNYAPRPANWWEACRYCNLERQRFRLTRRRAAEPLASVDFWDMEPLAASWGIRTAGVLNLEVHPEHRRRKFATYLLCEAFRELQKRGASMLEAHVMADNQPAIALYKGLDFKTVDTGRVYRKPGA